MALTSTQIKAIINLYKKKTSKRKIVALTGHARDTVDKYVAKYNMEAAKKSKLPKTNRQKNQKQQQQQQQQHHQQQQRQRQRQQQNPQGNDGTVR